MRRQKSNLNKSSLPSRVDSLIWNDQRVYIKRDDLLDPLFSGNKYRKLYYYLQQSPFNYSKIISYGGIQSNAMLSMAALAFEKELPFIYYTRYLPNNLSLDMKSNYSQALALGMSVEVLPLKSDEDLRTHLLKNSDKERLFIPQGGASLEARYGVELLAQEIATWKESENIDKLIVATPSGTGTTALWLHEYLKNRGIEVVTTAVVGSTDYLKEQMLRVAPTATLPMIIETEKNYPFAKPNTGLYRQYQNFLDKGISFDLIYATVMWQALEENQNILKGKTLLYVHSGGLMGNESQLKRYQKLLAKLTD